MNRGWIEPLGGAADEPGLTGGQKVPGASRGRRRWRPMRDVGTHRSRKIEEWPRHPAGPADPHNDPGSWFLYARNRWAADYRARGAGGTGLRKRMERTGPGPR